MLQRVRREQEWGRVHCAHPCCGCPGVRGFHHCGAPPGEGLLHLHALPRPPRPASHAQLRPAKPISSLPESGQLCCLHRMCIELSTAQLDHSGYSMAAAADSEPRCAKQVPAKATATTSVVQDASGLAAQLDRIKHSQGRRWSQQAITTPWRREAKPTSLQ